MNSKKYAEKYDGIYTRECERPNEIWQADHTMLDIEVLNEKNEIERPWLTIVLDDYSRAIAGFRIEFGTPDTERTALVLRQAIWKREIQIGQFVGYQKNSILTTAKTVLLQS